MDRLKKHRKIVQDILTKYTEIPYAHGNIESQTIFDYDEDRYMLIAIGWDKIRRVHGCIVHIDIINDKVWLQRDDTDSEIAYQMEEAGIPKDQIILGFHPPDIRPHTGYAVA